MIDYAKELQAFRPINMERIPTDDKRYTPQVKIAFELYNKALNEIKDGYRDIAKSDLRKAVALCPEFSAAIMVLGILVFANGDRIGAVRVFNSVKDSEDRARAIAILDRMISESEKPVSSSRDSTYYTYSNNTQAKQYSPRSNTPDNEETPVRKAYQRSSYRSSEAQQIEKKSAPSESGIPTQSPTYQKQPDIIVKNKYLLAIVALLIAFAIVAAAIMINMASGSKNENLLPTPGSVSSDETQKPATNDSYQGTDNKDYPLY